MGLTMTRLHAWLFSCVLTSLAFFIASCSLQANIPTVSDAAIERLVRAEAEQIVAVSRDKGRVSDYEIKLSDFPRRDILGMSIGKRRIYISHQLGRLASRHRFYLWVLRQTLAHEIAHETAGHAYGNRSSGFNRLPAGRGVTGADIGLPPHVRFRNYSVEKELEADLQGMTYWRELQWDCRIWVAILENFQQQNYSGGVSHPTDQRLRQAERVCPGPAQ
jgi:predicted Zn-dependent protease